DDGCTLTVTILASSTVSSCYCIHVITITNTGRTNLEYDVFRHYNEFAVLATDFEGSTGRPPPYPLPPSLEASTFYNDKSMVEEHCRELELFVGYLLSFSSDQGVWKLVVSKFLQLDDGTTSSSSLAFVGDSAGHPDIRQALYGYRPSSPLLSPSHDHQCADSATPSHAEGSRTSFARYLYDKLVHIINCFRRGHSRRGPSHTYHRSRRRRRSHLGCRRSHRR
ncbi:hypothetical protein Pmar_PMAR023085, partial [Perkinsus marinus ATCC 50983]